MKTIKNMLPIIGILFMVIGTIITSIVTLNYRNEAIDKREKLLKVSNENKELSSEIRTLSLRIEEQSKFIKNQITGGNSFPYSKLLPFTNDKNQKEFILQLYNDFDFPIKNLQFTLNDVDHINSNCIKENKTNGKYLVASCFDKGRKVFNAGDIAAKSKVTVPGISIREENISKKYLIEYNADNGRYLQKVLIKIQDGKVEGFAHQIIKEDKILKELPDKGVEVSREEFKNDFEFMDEDYKLLKE